MFITVKSVPEVNKCGPKKEKKKAENVKMKTWTRYANGHYGNLGDGADNIDVPKCLKLNSKTSFIKSMIL